MTKKEAFKEINDTQDYYINKLIDLINDKGHKCFKTIDFTSATGTGKTMMMSKLINLMPNRFFIITTLSKGQLIIQIRNNLAKVVKQDNYICFGSCDYKKNSKLRPEDILKLIPSDMEVIWLRDEGHIHTNKFDELLMNRCFKVINFSATNMKTDIKCNFTNTMMLRTVHQNTGTIKEAVLKLLEVKEAHKNVLNYNPCAIFRCVDSKTQLEEIAMLCKEFNLNYINITTEDIDMSELCEDNNKYDVIINKFKIVEGIDIRRAHVLYMDNQPSNTATTIQVIGRCRRNALLYRDDIDIFARENKKLLEETRKCYVYYNVKDMKISSDTNGELEYAFCDTISVQQLRPSTTIKVKNGKLLNGLTILELKGITGEYQVLVDEETGFNIIKPEGSFYDEVIKEVNYDSTRVLVDNRYVYLLSDLLKMPKKNVEIISTNYILGKRESHVEYAIDLKDKVSTNRTYTIHSAVIDYVLKFIKQKPLLLSDERTTIKLLIDLTKCIDGRNARAVLNNFSNPNTDLCFFSETSTKHLIGQDFKQIITNFKKGQDFSFEVSDFNSIHYYEYRDWIHNDVTLAISTIGASGHDYNNRYIRVSDLPSSFVNYTTIFNDRHSAIIGAEDMKLIKDSLTKEQIWVENSTITSKINKYCKFNSYIQEHYRNELVVAENNCFRNKNKFDFDSKCNACLGYCVEYYSKYLVYGESYLSKFIYLTRVESNYWDKNITDGLIVRACMLKYKDTVGKAYGTNAAKLVRTISVQQLVSEKYEEFTKTVIELGTKTARFVQKTLYENKKAVNNIDPNLCIRHLHGLADYITEDTILDIKTTNRIDSSMLRQVLAYHYLSTKRSDLHIKRVIVYDSVSDKNITINL